MPGEAGGRDQTLAQRLLSLVRYGPVVGENPTLQLVQVSGGKLHAAPGAVPILIIAPLEIHTWKESQRVTQFIWSGPCTDVFCMCLSFGPSISSPAQKCVYVYLAEQGRKIKSIEHPGDKKLFDASANSTLVLPVCLNAQPHNNRQQQQQQQTKDC